MSGRYGAEHSISVLCSTAQQEMSFVGETMLYAVTVFADATAPGPASAATIATANTRRKRTPRRPLIARPACAAAARSAASRRS